ncbi:MAG TPA: hypothetical protein DD811_11620 [Syntrophomonas sp.]|nr:hypothetical protein [Syntrophomonas sp.]
MALDSCTNYSLQEEIQRNCDVNLDTCYECGKCSGGCSNGHIFDFTPRKIIQLIKLGQENTLLHMDALWICVACNICWDRCPSSINIPRIMDYLREKAHQQGITATRPQVETFHRLMLDSIYKRGRVAEVPMMIQYNLAIGNLFNESGMAARMLLKGKLRPVLTSVKQIQTVRQMFNNPKKKEG